jgi:hypothetical protein
VLDGNKNWVMILGWWKEIVSAVLVTPKEITEPEDRAARVPAGNTFPSTATPAL